MSETHENDKRENIWKQRRRAIHAAFAKVLREAVPPDKVWQTGWHSRHEEAHLAKQLAKLENEPRLPCGGEEERRTASRLHRALERTKHDESRLPANLCRTVGLLAKKYRELDGRYYIFKPLQDKNQELWEMQLCRAAGREDVEMKRACELALKGIPVPKSDFYLEPLYVLQKVDGKRSRMVRIVNIHGGASEIVALPSDAFASPLEFRNWLLDNSNCANWDGGQTELTSLHQDVGAALWNRLAKDVPMRGYHEESKIWFFDDVAFAPGEPGENGVPGKARILLADRHGLIWWNGKGYRLSEKDQEGQAFVQQTPRMYPHETRSDTDVSEFFQEMSQKLKEAIGNYGAYLALGLTVSYAWGPELYAEHAGFPGLWLYGDPQHGKSSTARWMRWIWGFNGQKSMRGIPLLNSTKAGMAIALQQYGFLPIWFEEFQPNPEGWLIEVLKAIFGKESGIKKTFDEVPREIRAGAIVTGVGTSNDAQLRSRFSHILVSKGNRQANHWDWLQSKSERKFHWIGRYLMENRGEFARLASEQMRHWMNTDVLADCESRVRLVHGVAYASFAALSTMLESHTSDQLRSFKKYIVEHAKEADKEALEQVYLNEFFMSALAAAKAGEFGDTAAELGRYFKSSPDEAATCPVSELQRKKGEENPHCRWDSPLLYMTVDMVDCVRSYKRKLGEEMKLTRLDLLAQLKSRCYWRAPKGDVHRQRFAGSNSPQACWCIALDRHELGLRQVSDEEFTSSFQKADGSFWPKEEWVDPRKGPLFYLVDRLKPRQGDLSGA